MMEVGNIAHILQLEFPLKIQLGWLYSANILAECLLLEYLLLH